jgi:hypothetical protein
LRGLRRPPIIFNRESSWPFLRKDEPCAERADVRTRKRSRRRRSKFSLTFRCGKPEASLAGRLAAFQGAAFTVFVPLDLRRDGANNPSRLAGERKARPERAGGRDTKRSLSPNPPGGNGTEPDGATATTSGSLFGLKFTATLLRGRATRIKCNYLPGSPTWIVMEFVWRSPTHHSFGGSLAGVFSPSAGAAGLCGRATVYVAVTV